MDERLSRPECMGLTLRKVGVRARAQLVTGGREMAVPVDQA